MADGSYAGGESGSSDGSGVVTVLVDPTLAIDEQPELIFAEIADGVSGAHASAQLATAARPSDATTTAADDVDAPHVRALHDMMGGALHARDERTILLATVARPQWLPQSADGKDMEDAVPSEHQAALAGSEVGGQSPRL